MRPLRGVTNTSLERSFAAIAARGDGSNVTFIHVTCRETRTCTGTWRGSGPLAGRFRARYLLTGEKSQPECWTTVRRSVLEQPADAHGWTSIRHIVSDRISGCVDRAG
jgi:hypothetical protein